MIDAILTSAIGLPNWLITAIVGAVLGGFGGLLGALLQKVIRLPHVSLVLVVAAVVVSPRVSQWIVIPAIVTAYMNADLPKEIDEVTTLLRGSYDGSRYVYHYQFSDGVPQTTTAATLKSELIVPLCAHWGPQFAQKNAVGADYNYRLRNDILSFSVEPSDCQ